MVTVQLQIYGSLFRISHWRAFCRLPGVPVTLCPCLYPRLSHSIYSFTWFYLNIDYQLESMNLTTKTELMKSWEFKTEAKSIRKIQVSTQKQQWKPSLECEQQRWDLSPKHTRRCHSANDIMVPTTVALRTLWARTALHSWTFNIQEIHGERLQLLLSCERTGRSISGQHLRTHDSSLCSGDTTRAEEQSRLHKAVCLCLSHADISSARNDSPTSWE